MFRFRRKTREEIEAETVDALFRPAEDERSLSNAFGFLAAPHRYRRNEISTGVNFYSAGRGAGTLIVGFGTAKGRLGMPVFMVLDALDDHRYDLLLLSDFSKCYFDHGIDGYAASLPELMQRVGDFAGKHGYGSVITFGTSMGGFPALRGGDMLAAKRSISVGGRFPWHPVRLEKSRRRVEAFDSLCHCRTPFRSPFYLLFSRDHPEDPASADMIKKIAPESRIIAFPGDHHGLHNHFRDNGRLDAFFAEMLDLDREPDADKLLAMID